VAADDDGVNLEHTPAAFEERQGTKSQGVWHRQWSVNYGDLC
jgi:hypothetical protein